MLTVVMHISGWSVDTDGSDGYLTWKVLSQSLRTWLQISRRCPGKNMLGSKFTVYYLITVYMYTTF